MRLTNARHSIHDAFAIHLGGPTGDGGGGGVKFNSTKWLANAGTAGMIIKAVMDQPAHLRGTAIFLNAPENTITMNDMIAMKTGVWTHFIDKEKATSADQGVIVSYIDRILIGYRSRIWDSKSGAHTAGGMFSAYSEARRGRLTDMANRLIDVLAGYDSRSLVPIWVAIDKEREAEREETV